VATGGVVGAVGIVNPRRVVEAKRCAGGQLVGVPEPAVDTGAALATAGRRIAHDPPRRAGA